MCNIPDFRHLSLNTDPQVQIRHYVVLSKNKASVQNPSIAAISENDPTKAMGTVKEVAKEFFGVSIP